METKNSFISGFDLKSLMVDVDKDKYSNEELKEIVKHLVIELKEAERIIAANKIKFGIIQSFINKFEKF